MLLLRPPELLSTDGFDERTNVIPPDSSAAIKGQYGGVLNCLIDSSADVSGSSLILPNGWSLVLIGSFALLEEGFNLDDEMEVLDGAFVVFGGNAPGIWAGVGGSVSAGDIVVGLGNNGSATVAASVAARLLAAVPLGKDEWSQV
ncbi:MAG: hypothetical protein FRX48_05157 [Lasallia pustulata]|uniref:Uncharacterized protein n=1 Tax=Lasallia pustulata TaxID=136370 RepID=A0A5M8PPD5_9LECA|nr:MAG: hypothetical protein FRX48_05157 [Lasallia pustulata]